MQVSQWFGRHLRSPPLAAAFKLDEHFGGVDELTLIQGVFALNNRRRAVAGQVAVSDLFALASKLTHSCSAGNCVTRWRNGRGECRARIAIGPGELLSWDYTGYGGVCTGSDSDDILLREASLISPM